VNEGGTSVSIHQSNTIREADGFDDKHEESVDLNGLEHIFRWASDMVPESEDGRVKVAREKRIRRQVLDLVNKTKEENILTKANHEITYLQRRVIALLNKLQEVTEEHAATKSIMLSQFYSLQQMPKLEDELKQLQTLQYEKEAALSERKCLMDGLTKLKTERDYLEDLLNEAEAENSRLACLLRETRSELEAYKARRWWHWLFSSLKTA
jgi:hypothetical protein